MLKSVCLSQSLDPCAERDIMVMVSMASDDAVINEYVLADCFVYWLPSYEQAVFTFVFLYGHFYSINLLNFIDAICLLLFKGVHSWFLFVFVHNQWLYRLQCEELYDSVYTNLDDLSEIATRPCCIIIYVILLVC